MSDRVTMRARPDSIGGLAGTLLHSRRAGTPPFNQLLPALVAVLGAYLFFNRAFAWVHVPGIPIFAGEALLAVAIVQAARVPRALRATIAASNLARLLVVLLVAGALRTAWDVPTYGLDAIRDAAAPLLYGLLALIIAAMVIARPSSLDTMARWYRRLLPVFLLWVPIAVILSEGFEDVAPLIPDSETPIVSFKPPDMAVHAATAIAFLWLVERPTTPSQHRRRSVLTVVGLVGVLVAGTQFRSGFIAALAILGVTALLAPRRRQLIAGSVVGLGLLLAVALLVDLRVSLPRRELSLDQVAANVLSVVDDSEVDGNLQGTVEWRLELWGLAMDDLVDDDDWLAGVGFGPNLADRYDFIGAGGRESSQPLRSAHNSHLTIWVRGGIVLAVLWLLFWIALMFDLSRGVGSRRALASARTERRVIAWVTASLTGYLLNAVFDPSLEGPHVSVWAWTLVGIGMACVVLVRRGLGTTN